MEGLDIRLNKMRKLCAAAGAILLCAGVTACGGNGVGETTAVSQNQAETTVAAETEAVKETVQICVLYDERAESSNYLESCENAARKAAKEFEFELIEVRRKADTDWRQEFQKVCEAEYDLVIGTSAGFADLIAEYAENHPNTQFAVLDAEMDVTNVWSVDFSQKEGYFLAGALAAMTEGEGTLGWVTGIDIPIV